jgi:membrane-associated phospholipid phosphatase
MNKQLVKRSKLLPVLARLSPIIYIILGLLNCIVNPTYNAFYIFVIILALFPINWIIKHLIVLPIYNLLGKTTIPIIGLGKRPQGATSCNIILELDNKIATSFGMPSGHSQMAWTLGTYLICRIINNWNSKEKNKTETMVLGYIWLILSVLIILMSMIYISYSRVYIDGCHTIQQVIIGGLLGAGSGVLIWYYEDDAVNVLRRMNL